MELLRNLIHDEEGQGLVEYAMILGIVAIGVALVLDTLGTQIETIFTQIGSGLVSMPWD